VLTDGSNSSQINSQIYEDAEMNGGQDDLAKLEAAKKLV